MFKRIFLFISVNILVLTTISLTMNLLGLEPYLNAYGINFQSLLIFCGMFGFGGAFISLALSRFMAKTFMGVRVIDPNKPESPLERSLVFRVHSLAQRAGLPAMPEVGIFNSPEVNAFATGPSKAKSLVAVSTGLLHNMDDAAVEGVLGHEIAHIANGDMVTMTLLQGVVNTFVMFFARVIAWGIAQAASDRDDRGGGAISGFAYYGIVWVLEIFLSLLGAIVVAFFSRRREFRADAGGANLAGREKMVHALKTLKRTYEEGFPSDQGAVATLKISGKSGGLMSLLASHPSLDLRIETLQKAQW